MSFSNPVLYTSEATKSFTSIFFARFKAIILWICVVIGMINRRLICSHSRIFTIQFSCFRGILYRIFAIKLFKVFFFSEFYWKTETYFDFFQTRTLRTFRIFIFILWYHHFYYFWDLNFSYPLFCHVHFKGGLVLKILFWNKKQ